MTKDRETMAGEEMLKIQILYFSWE